MVIFALLGGSEAAVYVWYVLIGLYLLLPAYVVSGGWRGLAARQQIRLLWFLVLPTATFVTLWPCGRVIWALVWYLQLGVDGQYSEFGSWTSAIVALAVSATLFVRLATGRATGRYLRINSWGVALIAGLFCAQSVLEFADRIYGWSALSAAESYLGKFRGENHPSQRQMRRNASLR